MANVYLLRLPPVFTPSCGQNEMGLYHFLTCGCRKSQTNHASLRDLCVNCVRNCRLETTPAYPMRYLCCRKIKLRGHRICHQDIYMPVSSLVSIFCHKAVSCSKRFFLIHKDNKSTVCSVTNNKFENPKL
jgi:hypothetical protein